MTDVWISITGTQSADGESDTVELTTAGRLEQEEDGLLLTYRESESTGMEGVVTSLRVREDEVQLERSGAMSSLLVLEKGKRHMSCYTTPHGSLTMGVYTNELRNSMTPLGGELEFHYTLDINSCMTSSHDVRVSVRPVPSAPRS